MTTVAGINTTQGTTNGAAVTATFKYPCGVAVAASGNIYVADSFNNLIRKITPAGIVSTLAGSGTALSVNGTGSAATFNQPFSVVVDAAENLYVTDRVGAMIRKVTAAGVVTTLAGSGTVGFGDGTGTAAAVKFNGPTGLAIDNSGFLYVTDQTNNGYAGYRFLRGLLPTVSGTGTAGSTNGIGTAASLIARSLWRLTRPRGCCI